MGFIEHGDGVPAADSTRNVTSRDVIGNKTDAASSTADTASLMALLREVSDEVVEVDTHIHSGERWFGVAATPAGETNIADRVGAADAGAEVGPLVVDAGNDDWGTWTQILGSADTPVDGGSASYYDLHRMAIEATEDTAQRYIVQIVFQEDAPGDDPGSSDTYTEFEFISTGVGGSAAISPITFHGLRVASTTKAWMRTRAPDKNTSTISFYFGLHEYA